MLLFDWDDCVSDVRTLRARDSTEAARIANVTVLAHPDSAGYQLWQGGRKVIGTYPQSASSTGSSLAARLRRDVPRALHSAPRGD
jgi:hypothetical protein